MKIPMTGGWERQDSLFLSGLGPLLVRSAWAGQRCKHVCLALLLLTVAFQSCWVYREVEIR